MRTMPLHASRVLSQRTRTHIHHRSHMHTHTYGQITTRAFTHFSHRKNSMIFVNKRSVCAATNFNAHNNTVNRVDSDIVRREIEYQFIIELLPMCSLCRDRIYTQLYKCCSFRISWILWCLPFDNGEREKESERESVRKVLKTKRTKLGFCANRNLRVKINTYILCQFQFLDWVCESKYVACCRIGRRLNLIFCGKNKENKSKQKNRIQTKTNFFHFECVSNISNSIFCSPFV